MTEVGVFISHSWAYSEHYAKLAKWIFEERWGIPDGVAAINFVNFVNHSIPKDDPIHNAPNVAALELKIREHIAVSNVVVIPTGMYTNYSKWIKREIEGAQLFGRPILAVDPWGQERSSSTVMDASTAQCGWNKDSVVSQIYKIHQNYS